MSYKCLCTKGRKLEKLQYENLTGKVRTKRYGGL